MISRLFTLRGLFSENTRPLQKYLKDAYILSPTRLCSSTTTSDDPDAPIEIPNPFTREKKQCILCKLKIRPDYKNTRLLSQFQSAFTGRVYTRNITGLCKQQQRWVDEELLNAQRAGLLPFYHKQVEYLEDPKLFNPERPIRSHPY